MNKKILIIIFVSLLLFIRLVISDMGDAKKVSEKLTQKAQDNNVVRVIVRVDHTSMQEPNSGAKCENISCAQVNVANNMLQSEATLVEIIEGQPLIVMEVTEAGLATLENSQYVVEVVEDGLATPNDNKSQLDSSQLDAPSKTD